MTCENCGADKPVIQLTQIVDDEMRTLHLCEKCAAEQGVEGNPVPENFPLANFLAQMGATPKKEGASEKSAGGGDRACPFCGLTLKQFRDSGRLGCPECWSTFEPHLRGLLRRIHGSHQHVGKVYLTPNPTDSQLERQIGALRRKLERAVELEEFEQAAELRDRIHELEHSESAGSGHE
jgi:protein arginine kinase activator